MCITTKQFQYRINLRVTESYVGVTMTASGAQVYILEAYLFGSSKKRNRL